MDEFKSDLEYLMQRLSKGSNQKTMDKLKVLKDKLVSLNENNLVKINHSVMELTCARHLVSMGYDVDVEQDVNRLSCDLYAVKGFGNMIVEVETGFIPPEHALDPMTYCRSRIASKIARYSGYANKFCIGAPPHYVIQIPSVFVKPPRYRSGEEIQEIKGLCDRYYSSPPVSLEEIRNARLHAVYIIDVESGRIEETDPENYVKKTIIYL